MSQNQLVQIKGPAVLTFGALACVRTWLSLLYIVPASPQLSHMWFDIGYIALGVAVVATLGRIGNLAKWRWPYIVVLVSMTLASVCAGLCYLWPVPVVLRVLIAAASGVGFGLATLFNAASFVRLGLLRIVVYLAMNQMVSSFAVFLLEGLDPLRMTAVLVGLPIVAVWCLRSSFEVPCSLENGNVVLPLRSYPWRLYALMALFSLAYGMRQAQMVAGAGRHSSLSTGILMAVILVWVLYTSRRFYVARAAQMSFPLVAVGLLLVLLPGEVGAVVSAYCVAMSYTLVNFAVAITLYDISQRTGVSIVALLGVNFVNQAFQLIGDGVARAFSLSGTVMVIAVVLVILSLVLLFVGRGSKDTWGMGVVLEGSLPDEDAGPSLLECRCREVADRFSLTEREMDVLVALMGSQPGRVIANELGITQGTLKTHVRHIYEKVGVHTRDDLVELVGVQLR